MTTNEMLPAVGQTAVLRMEDLQIEVTIRDVKTAYGRVRLLVAPITGCGTQWLNWGAFGWSVTYTRSGLQANPSFLSFQRHRANPPVALFVSSSLPTGRLYIRIRSARRWLCSQSR